MTLEDIPILAQLKSRCTLNLKHVSYLQSPLELHSKDVLGVVAVVDLPHDGHVRRTQLPGNKISEQLFEILRFRCQLRSLLSH